MLVWVRPTDAEGAPLPPAIWAVPTLGGRLRPYTAAVELDWSPDGTRLAYHTAAAGDPIFVTEPGEGPAGGRKIFAGDPGLHNHYPVWSPDGAFIYFVHGYPPGETDIWRIRATGGEPQRNTFHDSTVSHPTPLDDRVAAAPAIAPDGRLIAFPVSRGGRTTLYLMDAEGTGARRLAESLDVRSVPAWSPDGRSIAVAGDRGEGLRLFSIPVAEGEPTPIVESHATDPLWSPDGRILAFAGPQVGPAFPVQAEAVSGKLPPWPELTLPRGVRGPSGRFAFLPGREALVVLEGELWHQNFWLIDLETGTRRQLTDFERRFRIGSFDISADGREIVFDRLEENSDIVLIDLAER